MDTPHPVCVSAMPQSAMEEAWSAVRERAGVEPRVAFSTTSAEPPAPVRRVYRAPGGDQFREVLEELAVLHERKSLDYGDGVDPLANITQAAESINVTPLAVCTVRMADKMQRLKSFFRRGEVEFDGIEDTLLDLAAYAVIGLIQHRKS